MVEVANPFTEVNRARFIVGHLGLTPAMKALDAGCDPGRHPVSLYGQLHRRVDCAFRTRGYSFDRAVVCGGNRDYSPLECKDSCAPERSLSVSSTLIQDIEFASG